MSSENYFKENLSSILLSLFAKITLIHILHHNMFIKTKGNRRNMDIKILYCQKALIFFFLSPIWLLPPYPSKQNQNYEFKKWSSRYAHKIHTRKLLIMVAYSVPFFLAYSVILKWQHFHALAPCTGLSVPTFKHNWTFRSEY